MCRRLSNPHHLAFDRIFVLKRYTIFHSLLFNREKLHACKSEDKPHSFLGSKNFLLQTKHLKKFESIIFGFAKTRFEIEEPSKIKDSATYNMQAGSNFKRNDILLDQPLITSMCFVLKVLLFRTKRFLYGGGIENNCIS